MNINPLSPSEKYHRTSIDKMEHHISENNHGRLWNLQEANIAGPNQHHYRIHSRHDSGAHDAAHQAGLGLIRDGEAFRVPSRTMEQYSSSTTTGFYSPYQQHACSIEAAPPTYAPQSHDWNSTIKIPVSAPMYQFGQQDRVSRLETHDFSQFAAMSRTSTVSEQHPASEFEKSNMGHHHVTLPESGLEDGLQTTLDYQAHRSEPQISVEDAVQQRKVDKRVEQTFQTNCDEDYHADEDDENWNSLPNNQRVYTSWSGSVKNPTEAMAILNKVKWRPRDGERDSTIPETDAQKLAYVQELYAALTDLSRFRDKLPGQSANKVNRLVAQRYSQLEIEARCFHVVDEVVRLHTVGSSISQAIDPVFELAPDAKGRASDQVILPKQGEAAYQVKKKAAEDMYLSFAARMAAICRTVRGCKAAATDIMDGQKIYSIIHTPKLAGATKEDNRKNNAAKQKKIAKGKQKLEEERLSSVVPIPEESFGALGATAGAQTRHHPVMSETMIAAKIHYLGTEEDQEGHRRKRSRIVA